MSDEPRPHHVEWTPNKVARFWDYMAHSPGGRAVYFSRLRRQSLVAQVRACCSPPAHVMDFGCGPGYLMQGLLEAGFRVSGMDYSATSVDEAALRCASNDGFWGVLHADDAEGLAALPPVDMITCIETVEHVLPQDVDEFFKRLGGLATADKTHLFITTPHDEPLELGEAVCPDCECVFHRMQHVNTFTASTLSAWMEQHGWSTLRCEPTHFRRKPLTLGQKFLRALGRFDDGTPHLFWYGKRA